MFWNRVLPEKRMGSYKILSLVFLLFISKPQQIQNTSTDLVITGYFKFEKNIFHSNETVKIKVIVANNSPENLTIDRMNGNFNINGRCLLLSMPGISTVVFWLTHPDVFCTSNSLIILQNMHKDFKPYFPLI